MIKKSLAFAGVLYPETCAQMQLYLDKVACNISEALEESRLAKNLLIFQHDSFENISHEALLGLITLAKNEKVKRIFLLSSLQDTLEESKIHTKESVDSPQLFQGQKTPEDPSITPLLCVCEAEVYVLLAREIPAVCMRELIGILGAFAPKCSISAQTPTPRNEIFLPLVSYAFRGREIALSELFLSDHMQEVEVLLQRILEDSSNAILLVQKGRK